jgi:hypothetical protein
LASPTKSPEDLKAILRTMTAKTGAEQQQKKSGQQQSLKGALADVLARSTPPSPRPEPKKPEPVAVPASTKETHSAPPPVSPQQEGKKPFEVSEDALRKVLKGEA